MSLLSSEERELSTHLLIIIWVDNYYKTGGRVFIWVGVGLLIDFWTLIFENTFVLLIAGGYRIVLLE